MKGRTIQTSFWSDDKIEKLTPNARYLFLYLMSNAYIGLTGAYQMSTRRMQFETGLPLKRIKQCLEELIEHKRIAVHKGNWIIVLNAHRHNRYHKSRMTGVAYNEEHERLPKDIQKLLPISQISELEERG